MKHNWLLLLLAPSLTAFGQTAGIGAGPAPQPGQVNAPAGQKHADELKQELDVNSALLAKIPADPIVRPDPLALLAGLSLDDVQPLAVPAVAPRATGRDSPFTGEVK